MTMIVTAIDVVYERILSMTVRFFSEIYDTFSLKTPPNPSRLIEQDIPRATTDVEIEEEEDTGPITFKTFDEVLRSKLRVTESTASSHVAAKNMVMYTSAIDVPVYINPTIEFDTQTTTIPFGEMVMMTETKGRFHHIAWNDITGWVLKEDVVDRVALIHPEFVIGESNLAEHPNTKHIRAILGDLFGVARTDFPLQAAEYVLYKLWEKEIVIDWPNVRPRTVGLWHQILRGVPRIHIGVIPKVGAVMEYIQKDDLGHVAYVDAVFPDNTISISETDYPDSGKYNERILTKEEWREFKPVFINVQ